MSRPWSSCETEAERDTSQRCIGRGPFRCRQTEQGTGRNPFERSLPGRWMARFEPRQMPKPDRLSASSGTQFGIRATRDLIADGI